MLGVGGTRQKLGRDALRGGDRNGRIGGGLDPQARKRELLRKLQERQKEQRQEQEQREEQEREKQEKRGRQGKREEAEGSC
ncbi:DUF6243 family protein [Streptomyces ziwulingensis]